MSVIINDFEVITEPLPSEGPETPSEATPRDEGPQSAPSPLELDDLLARRALRRARLRAH